jgi:hypothetical protein
MEMLSNVVDARAGGARVGRGDFRYGGAGHAVRDFNFTEVTRF